MAKRSLLLVDGDTRSLRVLEVSLKKAGFTVTTASDGKVALDIVEVSPPDLIISNTNLEAVDGFEFCRVVKDSPGLSNTPFIFLTDQTEIEHKIRGLELGVDEYLIKPIYIKEILTRVRILLQKADRNSLEGRNKPNTRFTGKLSDMGVVDLIQTVEVSGKSGVSHFTARGGAVASLYFRDGRVIDAELGPLSGAEAVYRLLTWGEGDFEVLFRAVRRRDVIDLSPQALLMEGMRRLDEWGRLLEQLPPLSTRYEVAYAELAERLAELPDELNQLLRLFDGHRSLMDVIDQTPQGDLESLELIAKLYFEGLIVESAMPMPSGETWPPPLAERQQPIDLPPARVRAASPSELEHEPGEDVYAAMELQGDEPSPAPRARKKRAESLVDIAIGAVAPVFPGMELAPSPEVSSSSLETSSSDSSPEVSSSSLEASSSASSSPAVSLSAEPADSPDPPSVDGPIPSPATPLEDTTAEAPAHRDASRDSMPVMGDLLVLEEGEAEIPPARHPRPARESDTSQLAAVKPERREIAMLPELVEKVRHMGDRDDRARKISSQPPPLPASVKKRASSAPPPLPSEAPILELVHEASDGPSLDDEQVAEIIDDAALEAASQVSAEPNTAESAEAKTDEVSEPAAEEAIEPPTAESPSSEVDSQPAHPPVEDDGEVTPVTPLDSYPEFDDEFTPPALDEPLSPAMIASEVPSSLRVISSDGAEIVAVAGAISSFDSSDVAARAQTGSIVIEDEELREPEEPTVEEPLGQRARQSSPPAALPANENRSPLTLYFAVAVAALIIGALFMLRRGPQAKVTAGESPGLDAGAMIASADALTQPVGTQNSPPPESTLDAGVAPKLDATPRAPDAAPIRPDEPTLVIDKTPRQLARELEQKANRARSQGQMRKALTHINAAISHRATGRNMATRADLLYALGKRSGAIIAADAAIKMSSGNASAWRTKGLAHYENEEYAAAKNALGRYLKLRPDSDRIRTIYDSIDQ